MEQLKSFAEQRLIANCMFCAGRTETRDHCPSRILLDEPYPAHLPVLPACAACNAGFSLDEEYFACLIECARTGSIEAVTRPKIQRILEQKPALAQRLKQARAITEDGGTIFSVEYERAKSVVIKLARGHAAFELSEPKHNDPSHIMIIPIHLLDAGARDHFENSPAPIVWPEVGSRAMQRMLVVDAKAHSDWIEVQEGQYRYLAVAGGAVMIRFVVSKYLACEVIWDD
jgi:hypothetical protein